MHEWRLKFILLLSAFTIFNPKGWPHIFLLLESFAVMTFASTEL
jgi:hypothetical protein